MEIHPDGNTPGWKYTRMEIHPDGNHPDGNHPDGFKFRMGK
jgi:hypothetical protein